jgi:hypothetical protein
MKRVGRYQRGVNQGGVPLRMLLLIAIMIMVAVPMIVVGSR